MLNSLSCPTTSAVGDDKGKRPTLVTTGGLLDPKECDNDGFNMVSVCSEQRGDMVAIKV
nr:hypothetical protein Iba_chr11cCG6290 [Ipomoea batatas]GME12839.1 hypothetical protein Iba_scaffold14178CG0060 [Ipomoea batatas]